MKYDTWARIDNADISFSETLNKLTGMRDRARYLKGDFKLSEKEAGDLLQTVRAMLEDAWKALRGRQS